MLKDASHKFWAIKSSSDMMILAICGTRLTESFFDFFVSVVSFAISVWSLLVYFYRVVSSHSL
jgi:hypothetical protein